MDRRTRQRGFSLIELLLVIGLLLIAAAVVVPALSTSRGDDLDLAATQVADALRFARAEALRTAAPHGVHAESSPNRLRAFFDASGTLPPTPNYALYHPVSKKLYVVDFDNHNLLEDVTLSFAANWLAACGDPERLGFDARGTPRCLNPWSSLLVQGTITLNAGGESRDVVIEGETGRVHLP